MKPETIDFIQKYVRALKDNNAVVFAGAGLSVDSGFFDWKKLLAPLAKQLGLDIEEEYDLTALAQYFVDANGGRGEITQTLVDRYNQPDVKISEKHRILARLPIQAYWTTNFDILIEQALFEAGKTADVKRTQNDLLLNLSKRDAIVYKMHGDISLAHETVLTKHEYEDYNKIRELFSNAFKSDFVAKTFLFIGFSFLDPNLDYLISRIRSTVGTNVKPDYYFIKIDADPKKQNRLQIRANSLKKYGLQPIWIDNYDEIEIILKEIEIRYLRNSIFISGSADVYDPLSKLDAESFLQLLSKVISAQNYKIVTGFGAGVGSSIINGVLDNMEEKRNKSLDSYIVMRPFPKIANKTKTLAELRKEYREGFISLAGIALFVFGNKNGGADLSDGVEKEFNIALEKGLKVIPIGATGYMAERLWKKVYNDFNTYYPGEPALKVLFEKLGDVKTSFSDIVGVTVEIINHLNSN